MEDYSDAALRTLCFRHGADLTFTEMARVEGLVRRNKPTMAKAQLHDDTPTQIQLLAGIEGPLEKFVSTFKPTVGFRGFNLNFSCPSKDVLAQGRGAAMIKRTSKAQKLVSIIKKYNFPVSVKLRLGTNSYEKMHKVYLNNINALDADLFIVHAKTAMQRSDDPSDYSVFPECVDAAKKKGAELIANGSIDNKETLNKVRAMGVNGVMIGRSAVTCPEIFNLLQGKPSVGVNALKHEYLDLANKFSSPIKYRENIQRNW